MSKEKQIEKMATLIYDNRPNRQIWNEDAESIAETLYNADYREQSEITNDVFKALIEHVKTQTPWGEITCEGIEKFQKEYMSDAGYRKQSEGEWTKEVTDMWHCSICLHPCLLNGGGDYVLSNYCPNCGAKMKGGPKG